MRGNCVIKDSVYKATVIKEGQLEGDGHVYVGLNSGLFKIRLANHEQSFKDKSKAKCELAKHIWKLKEKGINNFKIIWNIIAVEKCYNGKTRKCNLCQREKLEILKMSHNIGQRLINKRDEILRPCIHRFKHLLGNMNTLNIELPKIPEIPERQDIEGFTRSGRRWRNKEND